MFPRCVPHVKYLPGKTPFNVQLVSNFLLTGSFLYAEYNFELATAERRPFWLAALDSRLL